MVDASDDVGAPDGAATTGTDLAERRSVDELERLLDDVEAALSRLEDGSYGICASCGSPIDDARLTDSPATGECAGCVGPEAGS